MNTLLSSFFLILYILLTAVTCVLIWKKKWYILNHENLFKQKLFRLAILLPIFSFAYFGIFCWLGHKPQLDSAGMANFLEISKLPLLCLALTVPLGAIVSNLHRTYQVENQIILTNIKNQHDAFYSHNKHYVEMLSNIESRDLKLKKSVIYLPDYYDVNLKVLSPHATYKLLFPNSSPLKGAQYTVSGAIINILRKYHEEYVQAINDIDEVYLKNISAVGLDKDDVKFKKIESVIKRLGTIYGFSELTIGRKLICILPEKPYMNIAYTALAMREFNLKIDSISRQLLALMDVKKKNEPELYELLSQAKNSMKTLFMLSSALLKTKKEASV